MKPGEVLDDVVTPNVVALGSDRGNVRLAVNAILSLDALVGIFHADQRSRGQTSQTDSEFREAIAVSRPDFRIVRDTAFALKHGERRRRAFSTYLRVYKQSSLH